MKHHTRPTILSLRSCSPLALYIGEPFERSANISGLLSEYAAGKNPLYICGHPKSGKTIFSIEIAKEIARSLSTRLSMSDERRVHIIPYCENIKRSICKLYIPGYILLPWNDNWGAPDDVHNEQCYREKLQILKDYAVQPSIFILDDVTGKSLKDLESEPEYQDLLSLGVVIIVSDDTVSYPDHVIPAVPDNLILADKTGECTITPDERKVLQNAYLLPPDGMGRRSFIRAMGGYAWYAVGNLIDNKLLPSDQTDRIFPYTDKLIGNDEDYLPFLEKVYQAPTRQRSYYSRVWNRSCYILSRAAELLPDLNGQFAYWAAELHRLRGDYTVAIKMFELFLRKQQAIAPPCAQMLSQALFEVGNSQVFLGDNVRNAELKEYYFQKASEYLDSAIAVQSSEENLNLDLLSDIILMKAWLLKRKGDFRISDRLCSEVLFQQEKVHSLNNEMLAPWYIKVASLYAEPGAETRLREKYTKKALDLLLTPDAKNNQALADVCMLMESCVDQSDIGARISWEHRALSSLEKNSPWCRHLIYRCHLHLAYLAECNSDPGMQEKELRTAIAILLEMLPANHPRIRLHAHSIVELSKKASTANNNFSS